jgi:hypothetical protein
MEVFSSKLREVLHASEEEVQFTQKIGWAEVQQVGRKVGGQRRASQKERYATLGQKRQRRESKKPQTGYRNRAF